jgi:hypothetical protein
LDLLGSLLLLALDSSALVLHTLLSPLAGSLGLRTLGVHLLLELGLAGSLSLGLVNLCTMLDDVQSRCVVATVKASHDVVA